MDYVPGSVAALITGNVTPNRPRLLKRALTPTKHQVSPDVTPKCETSDRSKFLSPTLQRKKAIVKKSPKRIFQNPELDMTDNDDSTDISPKAEKVKKHLNNELETNSQLSVTQHSKNNDVIKPSATKKSKLEDTIKNIQCSEENTLIEKKKHKNKEKSFSDNPVDENEIKKKSRNDDVDNSSKAHKKKKKRNQSQTESIEHNTQEENVYHGSESKNENDLQITPYIGIEPNSNKKKNRKHKNKAKSQLNDVSKSEGNYYTNNINNKDSQGDYFTPQKNNKIVKNKKQNKQTEAMEITNTLENNQSSNNTDLSTMDTYIIRETRDGNVSNKIKKKKSKKKEQVNPNAITNKDSESEHDSDNEIESESEKINNQILDKEQTNTSSDEEEETQKTKKKDSLDLGRKENDPDELKRTLFVGNVPFSKKCKKEIKKIFNKYGQIETVRIRTIPVKDARDTPKLAAIKNELHPERSTVNVYVKFANAKSVDEALVENNTILNECHLRVSRSNSSGAEHDPHCSVFVGNLPFALEDEALRAKFENCGEIESVRIIRDKKTNAGKGFGYVNFKSKDGVELALGLSEENLTIKNRILRVKRCTQNAQKQGGNKFNRGGNRFKEHGDRQHGKFQPNQGKRGSFGRQERNEPDGALKRIMNKRKYQDTVGEGPSKKRQNADQPRKEKKQRKEFVGMTAGKKKKQKFDKGQKKKKMLSEILTK